MVHDGNQNSPCIKPVYKFTVQAKRDLDEIRDYTRETWGADQTYVYLGRLRYGIESIEADPGAGKDRRELLAGMRSLAVGSHTVFYIQEAGVVIIVRILHQRMDPLRHF